MAKTKISWADQVWNPITGCTKVSAGCTHCYAERMATRLASWMETPGQSMGDLVELLKPVLDDNPARAWAMAVTETTRAYAQGNDLAYQAAGIPGMAGYPEKPNQFKVTLHEDKLWEPGKWKTPQRVFVCSMSDLFHPDVPVSFIDKMFGVMADTPRHTYLVLTKRPERMKAYFDQVEHINLGMWMLPSRTVGILNRWPLPNVWVGTSVEGQKAAEERIPALLDTPAVVHFVSCEPMLGPVDLTNININENWAWDVLRGWHTKTGWADYQGGCKRLDWVICGGESGPGARPMHPNWAGWLRDHCAKAKVPFLFKQWGEWIPDSQVWKDPYVPWETINQEAEKMLNHYPHLWLTHHEFEDHSFAYRVGKKAAGRMLDGKLWDEYPEVK